MYVKQELSFSYDEPQFEEGNCLLIRLDSNTVVLAIYRSPSFKKIDKFLGSLDNLLKTLSSVDNIIITGDVNIAINLEKTSEDCDLYLDLLAYHGLFPAHSFVTRDESGTCLDHVMIKTELPALTLVPLTNITDHRPTLLCLERNMIRNYAKTTYSKIDSARLKEDVSNIDLYPIYNSKDPNFALSYLIEQIQTTIKNNTKTIILSRHKKIIKPWITSGLLRCIRNRDQLHKKSRNSPNNEILKLTYTRYRNFCNSLIKKIKITYNKDKLEKAGKNSKKLWSAVREISGTNTVHDYPKELLTLGNSPISSVNKINNFFVNVGKNLAESIAPITPNLTKDRGTLSNIAEPEKSFALINTDPEEVERLILGLKNECSIGWDGISNRFLKENRDFLIPPLTYICNLCFEFGIFPNDLKKSIIIPIYKNGDRNSVNNFRPISILPSISKILERLMNNRLVRYLEQNKILSSNQFGFRCGNSTDDAVHKLTRFISEGLDKRKKTIAVFLDLAKAFDTVSVRILVSKLQKIGIRGDQLALFKNYLTGRYQSVKLGNHISDWLPVTHGVPQGSILGPTLFLIYINDLCSLNLEHGELISYADDTVLMFTADTWQDAYDIAQTGFNKVTTWLHDNILSLNTEKTKYITFSITNTYRRNEFQLFAHTKLCLTTDLGSCDCKSLKSTITIKYLGIVIDNNLNFKQHIVTLSKRIRKTFFIFKKLRSIAKPELVKQIYLALCQSIITYCISSWGGAPKTTLRSIEISQRAALKISTGRPILFDTALLYKSCDVLTVRQLFIVSIVLKQHSLLMYDPLTQTKRRKHDVCRLPQRLNTTFIKRFLIFLGPFLYNKINKSLNIYDLSRHEVKFKTTLWLKSLTSEETEKLLEVVK